MEERDTWGQRAQYPSRWHAMSEGRQALEVREGVSQVPPQ